MAEAVREEQEKEQKEESFQDAGGKAEEDFAKELEEEGEAGFELGDYLLFTGGRFDKLRGYLYGFSEKEMRILPVSLNYRVEHIQIDEETGLPLEEYGIQGIELLKKSTTPSFTQFADLRPGLQAETFDSAGNLYGRYMVKEVNVDEDSAIFVDDAGGEEKYIFDFQGIPPGTPFEVIRTREPPAPEEAGKEGEEEVGIPDAEVDDEDLASGEGKGEEGVDDFAVGEEIELPAPLEITELSSAERIYPDDFQRSEMLSHLIRMLPEAQQRNPLKLQEVRRLVELFMNMRRDLIQYDVTGMPIGMKATSYIRLADLMQRPDATLTRKIANMKKEIVVDSAAGEPLGDFSEVDLGDEAQLTTIELKEWLKGMDTTVKEQEKETVEGLVTVGLPKFYLDQETLRRRFQTPYVLEEGKNAVQRDEEVFRSIIPNLEEKPLEVLASVKEILGEGAKKKEFKEFVLTNPPKTKQAAFATMRLLKERIGRFKEGEKKRTIEEGDKPEYNEIAIFPRETLRDIGPIRSGSLTQDVSLGMTTPSLMNDILEKYQPEDEDEAGYELGRIFYLGLNGLHGNMEVKEWIQTMDLVLDGIGDVYQYLSGYGVKGIEFNTEQIEIIQSMVNEHLAALKIFLIKQREENQATLKNLRFEPQQTLSVEDATSLRDKIAGEPLLQETLEKLTFYTGELSQIDSYWFSFIYKKYADFLLSVLGQNPEILVKERNKARRDIQMINDQQVYTIKKRVKEAGEPPQPNPCPHVKDLEDVRKAGKANEDEPRDATKMKLLMCFLNKYKGQQRENWVWCNKCGQHLICGHELLLLQEFLRPKEREVVHKELLIKFSGGQFSGKFICRDCGQAIQDLDFDTNLEFDDEGRPMMGRSVMVDVEAIQQEELEDLVKGPAEIVKEISFNTPEQNDIYKVIKKLAGLMGIAPDDEDYKEMVRDVTSYTTTLPTRKKYEKMNEGKQKVTPYDTFYSIKMITASGLVLLVNYQTHIPEYIIYYTHPACQKGFYGYPLEESEGGVKNETGIENIATLIGSVSELETPWTLTRLQRLSDMEKRRKFLMESPSYNMKDQLEEILKVIPFYTARFQKKREYRIEVLGTVGTEKKERIAPSFRPIPFLVTEEEAAKEPVFAEASTPEKAATAWIMTSHGLARQNAAIKSDSPFTTTSCCQASIQQPRAFWKKMEEEKKLPALEPKHAGKPQFRTTTLTPTFYTEKPELLSGELKSSEYYKLFMKVCWQGENKGLSHELGLDLKCGFCGIQFSKNPNLPLDSTKKEDIEKEEAEIKRTIESQGIPINEETFYDLVHTAQLKSGIQMPERPLIPREENTFSRLANLPFSPVPGWKDFLTGIQTVLAEHKASGTPLTPEKVRKAVEPLETKVYEIEDSVREILFVKKGDETPFKAVRTLLEKTPRECGEALMTYFLVPFQRWILNYDRSHFFILKSYELSTDTQQDILEKGLKVHLDILGSGGKKEMEGELKGLMLAKVKYFIDELRNACAHVFPFLRGILTPGGEQMVKLIMRAYVMGPISRLLDSHHVPEGSVGGRTISPFWGDGPLVLNLPLLKSAFGQALTKYAKGSRVPSEAEIRIKVEERAKKETDKFIEDVKGMNKTRRAAEMVFKNLGLGEYAVGGTKAIRQYDADRYEEERLERAQAGITDYDLPTESGEGRAFDMFGFESGAENVNDGYDVGQGEYDQED